MRLTLFSLITLFMCVEAAAAQTPGSGLQIVGRVLDASSRAPISDVRVTVSALARTTSPAPPPMTITDENGTFSFAGLVAGRVRLMAQKQGYVFDPASASLIELASDRPITRVDLVLRRGGVITGRVLDSRGEPLPEITVMLMRKKSAYAGSGMASIPSQTNDLGEFRLAGIMEGEYALMATPRSATMMSPPPRVARRTAFVPTYYPGVHHHTDAESIFVRPGETVAGLEFRMISAPAFTVTGVVVDEQGRAVPDAMVQLFYDVTVAGPPPTFGVRTNPDGTFAITGVVSGKYSIAASPLIRAGTSIMTRTPFTMGRQEFAVDNADVAGLTVIARTNR